MDLIRPDDSISQYSGRTAKTAKTGVSAAPAGVHRISQKSCGRTLGWLAAVGVIAVGLIVLVNIAPWKHNSPPPPPPRNTTTSTTTPPVARMDQTDVTRSLNDQIKEGSGLYNGGKGVLVRTPDLLDNRTDLAVVPASFWVNDIKTPSQLYPNGNPWCPHGKSDGYEDLANVSKCDDPNGPWDFATVAFVVGDPGPDCGMRKIMKNFDDIQKDSWGWGVFYATDSNSADGRCHWRGDDAGWDCPGFSVTTSDHKWQVRADKTMKGAGSYSQGNPQADLGGGGAGCHWQNDKFDQVDAYVGKKPDRDNLVQDEDCQCNYNFKGDNDWAKWVQDWIDNNQQQSGFEWRAWLHGRGKAPSWAVDSAICWVNNPRDMIAMQNAIYAKRDKWNNGLAPQSTGSDRIYWGWNEVPVTRTLISDPLNWDAVMIKLPAQLCGGQQDHLGCLGTAAQQRLEEDLDGMVKAGKLLPGADHITTRPGSYMVVVREFEARKDEYQRQFYCETWVSPNHKYQLVFESDKAGDEAKKPGSLLPRPWNRSIAASSIGKFP